MGKTIEELEADYKRLKALAEQDINALNSGRGRPDGFIKRLAHKFKRRFDAFVCSLLHRNYDEHYWTEYARTFHRCSKCGRNYSRLRL